MTTTQHDPASQQPLSPRARAAWRRAADELLIDAIFGADYKPFSVGEPPAVPPEQREPAPNVP